MQGRLRSQLSCRGLLPATTAEAILKAQPASAPQAYHPQPDRHPGPDPAARISQGLHNLMQKPVIPAKPLGHGADIPDRVQVQMSQYF